MHEMYNETMKLQIDHTPGTTSPTLFNKCVGSLTSPADHVTLKMQETGPTVYSPYRRRQRKAKFLNCGLCCVSFAFFYEEGKAARIFEKS